jgi:hypothetical protein
MRYTTPRTSPRSDPGNQQPSRPLLPRCWPPCVPRHGTPETDTGRHPARDPRDGGVWILDCLVRRERGSDRVDGDSPPWTRTVPGNCCRVVANGEHFGFSKTKPTRKAHHFSNQFLCENRKSCYLCPMSETEARLAEAASDNENARRRIFYLESP